MVSEYDFWLLDLDGTLVDVEWRYTREVFDRVGDRLGREFTDQEADILWNGLTGSRNAQLRAWNIDPDEFWDAFHAEEDPLVRAEQTYLHEDAAFVGDLERPVGLVTHCQEFLADPVLDNVGIRDWFDTILCCTEETGWKPDPTPVEQVMQDLGVAHNGHRGWNPHQPRRGRPRHLRILLWNLQQSHVPLCDGGKLVELLPVVQCHDHRSHRSRLVRAGLRSELHRRAAVRRECLPRDL